MILTGNASFKKKRRFTVLETYLKEQLKKKEILLMTHIVVGYPSFEESMNLVETMVNAGVDMMELQIPFSEPMADGPVILRANQRALEQGATVEKCMAFAAAAAKRFHIPFLIMTYYNILFKYVNGARAIFSRPAIVPSGSNIKSRIWLVSA